MGVINIGVMLFDVCLFVVKLDAFLVDDFGHMVDLFRSHWSLAFVSTVRNFGSAKGNSSGFGHSCKRLSHFGQGTMFPDSNFHHASSTAT